MTYVVVPASNEPRGATSQACRHELGGWKSCRRASQARPGNTPVRARSIKPRLAPMFRSGTSLDAGDVSAVGRPRAISPLRFWRQPGQTGSLASDGPGWVRRGGSGGLLNAGTGRQLPRRDWPAACFGFSRQGLVSIVGRIQEGRASRRPANRAERDRLGARQGHLGPPSSHHAMRVTADLGTAPGDSTSVWAIPAIPGSRSMPSLTSRSATKPLAGGQRVVAAGVGRGSRRKSRGRGRLVVAGRPTAKTRRQDPTANTRAGETRWTPRPTIRRARRRRRAPAPSPGRSGEAGPTAD